MSVPRRIFFDATATPLAVLALACAVVAAILASTTLFAVPAG